MHWDADVETTVTPITGGGKLKNHVFAALAEVERDVIREQPRAGHTAARARGWPGGRSKAAALGDVRKLAPARALYANKNHSLTEICRILRVSRPTL